MRKEVDEVTAKAKVRTLALMMFASDESTTH